MRTIALVALTLAGALALSACHSQPAAGGLTADQEQQLDNAAAMLDDPIFNTAPGTTDGNDLNSVVEDDGDDDGDDNAQ